MSKHTPGPWTVTPLLRPDLEDDPLGVYVVEPVHTQLTERYAEVFCIGGLGKAEAIHAENEANARLIAAAPALLDVAKRLARYCEQHSVPDLQGIACDAFRALDLAEGKEPT